MLQKLDTWVLDKVCQPISDYTMNQFGRSNFWIAGQLFLFNTVIAVVDVGYRLMLWMESGRDPAVFSRYVILSAALTPLIIFVNYLQYRWCEKQEIKFHENQLGNFVNERRISNGFVRMLFLMFALMQPIFWMSPNSSSAPPLVGFLGSLLIFSIGAALYFQSCTPHPPSRSYQTRAATSFG